MRPRAIIAKMGAEKSNESAKDVLEEVTENAEMDQDDSLQIV